ncbi:MAG: hypothetical protein ACREBR_05225 [bacterium]
MKRSSIYLRDKLSERELELLKKDLIDHSVVAALNIKNLGFSKNQIEIVVINAVERVLFTYKFGSGGSLGDLVKMQVMADLRLEVERAYPDMVTKIQWPDLVEKKPFDRLLELLQKIRTLSEEIQTEIFDETNELLNGRQQKLLSCVYVKPSITYGEICKQFGTRGVMTYREVKIIHAHLLQTLKFLEINL